MRRTSVLLLLIFALFICTIPCTIGEAADTTNTPLFSNNSQDTSSMDPRLQKKVTYCIKLKPVSDVVSDLAKQTDIKLYAGRSLNDWRVREEKMSIFAKDVPFAALMDSIAHVMKFVWIRSGDVPNQTYRLVEDQRAIREVLGRVDKQKKEDQKARQDYLDLLARSGSLSAAELEKLREKDPMSYIQVKTGIASSIADFLNEAPIVKNAWLNGEELTISGSRLSSQAKKAFIKTIETESTLTQSFFDNADDITDRGANQLEEYFDRSTIYVYSQSYGNRLGYITSDCGTLPLQAASTSNREKRVARAMLKAYEEKRSLSEVMREMPKESDKESKDESWTPFEDEDEFLLQHDDLPILHTKLRDEIDTHVQTKAVEQLSKASGLAIVIDGFKGKRYNHITKDSELGDVLKQISKNYYYNWNISNDVIELWSRSWYNNRESRVSQLWLYRLKDKFKNTGTLDADDLVEISMLTTDQFSKNISRDDILRYAADMVRKQRDYLKLYGSLNSSQRSMLFSGLGLSFNDMSKSQQQSVMSLVAGIDVSVPADNTLGEIDLRVAAVKTSSDGRYIYKLKATTDQGYASEVYVFRTPIYPKK